MKIFVFNTGGTLGMTGKPLRPAKSGEDLFANIAIPEGIKLTFDNAEVLQDSTNITLADRIAMANRIKAAYAEHDAFVVLHGTDTLAETTSAFCMIFKQTLQKPLFVIGSQMTKDEIGSDVPMQLANTMRVAKAFHANDIVGVYTVSISDVWDGSRLRKRAESDFNAFHTPGRRPVARVWPRVFLGEGLRFRDDAIAANGLHLDVQFERNLATIRVCADTPPWVLSDLVDNERLKGAILECKGAGQIPDRTWEDDRHGSHSWINAIAEATEHGIHVGILSPFEDGRVVLDRYELGQKAHEAGAISMESLTPDMADAKFRQAIAIYPDDPGMIQEFISTNYVGELLPGIEETD